ncbi:MAG: hypothetical protein IKV38_01245 [Clostridia bacterium]|nr:hypothetical protein [Clostridia bacterium]
MQNNTTTNKKENKAKWIFKRIFIENWFAKLGAIFCGILLWLCIGYLF